MIVPIYPTSTYKQDGVGGLRGGYEYSRSANPTRTALQECLAALEGGVRGLAFASGLAAEDTLLRTVCGPGDHVVVPDDAYGGTYRLFAKVLQLGSGTHGGADRRPGRGPCGDPAGRTKVLWVESPTNPLLGIADLTSLAHIAHEHEAPGHRQHFRLALPAAAAAPARTWSCTRPPSTSVGTAMWSAAPWWWPTRPGR